MTDSATDVLRSDAAITDLAERSPTTADNPVLIALAAWVADIDRHPVPDGMLQAPPIPSRRGSIAGRAVVLTVALTLSSSGVAAAVSGNPWAPLTYVVTKITTIGHTDDPGRLGMDNPARRVGDLGSSRPMFGKAADAPRETSRREHPDAKPDAPSTSAATSPLLEAERSEPPAHSQPPVESQHQASDVIRVPGHTQQPPHRPTPPDDESPPPKPRDRLPIPQSPPIPDHPQQPPEKPAPVPTTTLEESDESDAPPTGA